MEQKRNKFQQVNIGDLVPLVGLDFKQFDGDKLLKLQNSVLLFGQSKPVVCVEIEGSLCAIEGRKLLTVLKRLNYEQVWCVIIKTELSALFVNICVNELHFDTDYIALSKDLLKESASFEQLKNSLPFTEDEITKIKSIASFDWNTLVRNSNPGQESLFDDQE